VTATVLVVFAGTRSWEGSSDAIHIGLTRIRYLLLWIDILLLVLPVIAFFGLSRNSWNVLAMPPRTIPSTTLIKTSWKEALLVIVLAMSTVAVVFHYAWISEDSFITFRYVSNTIDGFGPVFNVGERVQGFTHPLWFILLVLGSMIGANPIYLSMAYGLVLTFLTIALLGYALARLVRNRVTLAVLIALACLLWSLSDAWLSFQTGGLENALSNLLITAILIEAWLYSMRRPVWLLLLVSLLCLTRPDFIVFIAPVVIVLLARRRSVRTLLALTGATSPALAWLVFAWTYYGDVLPNTAYAKLGIYPNSVEAIGQGIRYLQDWFTYDTVAAVGAVLFLGFAIFATSSKERIASVLGVIFYTAWIVWIGGDFMRGRMLTPVLTAVVVIGSLAVAERNRHLRGWEMPFEAGVAAGLILALFLLQKVGPDPGAKISQNGIVNERMFYPGYHLSFLLDQERIENPYLDLQLAEELRRFAQACGHTTIHLKLPGTIAYLAGPNVSVIDTLGLTDAYIARLPREYLISSHPRPGHPHKYIPLSYLLSRRDLAVLPGWAESISRGDCSLFSKLDGFQYSSDLYRPP
jgi:arabinofuranosyltransferase